METNLALSLLDHPLSRFYFYPHPSNSAKKVDCKSLVAKARILLQNDGINAELELFCKGTRGGRIKQKSLYHGGAVGVIDQTCSENDTGKGFIRVVFNACDALSMIGDWIIIDALSVHYYTKLPNKIPQGYRGFLVAYVPNVGFSANVFKRVDELLQSSKEHIECFDFLTTLLAELEVFVKFHKLNFVNLEQFNNFFDKSFCKMKLEKGFIGSLEDCCKKFVELNPNA